MVAGCSSSGVITASKVVSSSRCKLVSLHVTSINADANVIKVWDSNDSTTTGDLEIVRINVPSGNNTANNAFNMEFDMHGVIAAEVLYVQITGSGTSAVTVTFA